MPSPSKPRQAREPVDELGELLNSRTLLVTEALNGMVRANINGTTQQQQQAQQKAGDILIQTAALADMIGRRRLMLELDAVTGGGPKRRGFRLFALDEVTPIAVVPFSEAIEDILDRDPRLAIGWLEVQRVYTRERGFSLAKSLDETITANIQRLLGTAIEEGRSPTQTQDQIIELAQGNALPFTNGYAETVFRTNATTAFTAGTMRQARSPAVRAVTPGFRYDTAGFGSITAQAAQDVRPNHAALDGMVAAQDDPVWDTCSPPLGYNCRCALALATRAEMRQAGVIKGGQTFQVTKPSGGGPDEGFNKTTRTDTRVYSNEPDPEAEAP